MKPPRPCANIIPEMEISPPPRTSNLDTEAAWRAFEQRVRAADGRFVVAVRTTGIYCRPSCAARRPRRNGWRPRGGNRLRAPSDVFFCNKNDERPDTQPRLGGTLVRGARFRGVWEYRVEC